MSFVHNFFALPIGIKSAAITAMILGVLFAGYVAALVLSRPSPAVVLIALLSMAVGLFGLTLFIYGLLHRYIRWLPRPLDVGMIRRGTRLKASELSFVRLGGATLRILAWNAEIKGTQPGKLF